MEFSTLPGIVRLVSSLIGYDVDHDKVIEYKDNENQKFGTGLKSIVDTIQPLLVDPRVVISPQLKTDEHTKDVLTVMLNTFSMYYLQAFTMLGDVIDVKTKNTLKDLASIKRVNTSNIGGVVLEEFHHLEKSIYSLEEYGLKDVSVEDIKTGKRKQDFGPELYKDLSHLALAKILQLKITPKKSDARVTIPVMVRLSPASAPADVIEGILGVTKMRHSLFNRIDDLRAGNISFFKDFIFNQDLVKEHQRLMMKDKTGLYSEVSNKVNQAILRYGKTGAKGYGAFYNMVVITEQDLKSIEKEVGGSLQKKKYRDRLFSRNFVVMLCVMDREWERATFYTRDMDTHSDIGYDMLKSVSNKDSSADLMKMLKSFSSNSGVVF